VSTYLLPGSYSIILKCKTCVQFHSEIINYLGTLNLCSFVHVCLQIIY